MEESLREAWLKRLDSGPVRLARDIERFPELRDAVLPEGFSIAIDEDSYLASEDDEIQSVLRARLIPPGARATATPPESGAIGLDLNTGPGYAEIETLDMPARAQRRGLGRLAMASIADLGDQLGLEALILEAGKTGRYAWARCGFRFMELEDRRRVLEAAHGFADALGISADLDAIDEPWQLAELAGEVKAAEVEEAGGPKAPPGQEGAVWNLGRALLLGPDQDANTWLGTLNPIRENPDRVRLDAYART